MTREEILKEYEVDRNWITSPGKFEGEPIYAPYFHEHADDGEELSFMEDGWGEYVSLVSISDEDRKEFPELGDALYCVIQENDEGFVCATLLNSETEADDWRAEYEREENEEDPEGWKGW